MSGKSELLIFARNNPQIVVAQGVFDDQLSSSPITAGTTSINFHIRSSQTHYLDLNDTTLYVKFKIFEVNGDVLTALAADAAVLPCNYLMNSLFKDVVLSLNNVVVEGGNQSYSYKSTFECIFNFSKSGKHYDLGSMGYSEDEPSRMTWCNLSDDIELVGALRLGMLNQPKYLIPGVDMQLSLTRENSAFSISGCKAGLNLKIVLSKAELSVRRCLVNPLVFQANEAGLAKKNAVYQYTHGKVVQYTIAQGSQSHYKDDIFSSSLLPKFVIVGMVKGSANSSPRRDPYHFESFDMTSMVLYHNGQSVPFRTPYEGTSMRDFYRSIRQNTGHMNTNFDVGIDYDNFCNQYTLYTFNLAPDYDMSQVQVPCDGNLRLEIKFQSPLRESINVCVYGTFDAQIEITKDREVIRSHVF
jgi:hypothetical protein